MHREPPPRTCARKRVSTSRLVLKDAAMSRLAILELRGHVMLCSPDRGESSPTHAFWGKGSCLLTSAAVHKHRPNLDPDIVQSRTMRTTRRDALVTRVVSGHCGGKPISELRTCQPLILTPGRLTAASRCNHCETPVRVAAIPAPADIDIGTPYRVMPRTTTRHLTRSLVAATVQQRRTRISRLRCP